MTPTPAKPALLSEEVDWPGIIAADPEPTAREAGLLLMYQAQAAELQSLRERVEAAEKDAARIDAIATGYWKVDPFDIPTGQGDADVGWRVAEYHQSAPTEREVAVEYGDDLRAAIDAAIAKGAQS